MYNKVLIQIIPSAFLITICTNLQANAFDLTGTHKVYFNSYDLKATVPGIVSNLPVGLDRSNPFNSFEKFDFDNNKVYQQVDVTASFGEYAIKAQLYGSGSLQNIQVSPTSNPKIYNFLATTNITNGGFTGDESDEYTFEHTEFQNLTGTITLDSQNQPNFIIDKTFIGSGFAKTLPGANENINVPVQYTGTATLASVAVPEPTTYLADMFAFGVLGTSFLLNRKLKKI